jgi:hypothetical protein
VTVRRPLLLLLALAAGVSCSLLVAACGGGDSADLIPASRASSMTDQLNRIDAAVRRGRCTGVPDAVAQLQGEVNDLSGDVDAGLRNRLQEGVQNLNDIADRECLDNAQTTTTTQTTQTETTTTETTPTDTTTETTPTTPTDTTTETTPTTPTDTTTTPPAATPTTPDSGGVEVPGEATTAPSGAGGASPTP